MVLRYCFMLFLLAGLSACGANKTGSISGKISDRDWNENKTSPAERTYCSTSLSYSGPTVSISGKAHFQYRPISIEPEEEGLREVASDTKAIRHAQYEVLDRGLNIIQCGETDANGNFSFQVPSSSNVYSLRVYSRSLNNFNKVSVFKAPETNELYFLNHNFIAEENISGIDMLAEARGTVIAGAFNIQDQIHLALDRLQNLTSTTSGAITPSQIPKVDIYWEKGFNPGIYARTTGGLSFFSRVANKLFILGGDNGDVDFADTDHFDSSIILHEYFHFLENNISQTDSPGGPHNGNELLDPRLAWSEGAAQFFQSAILNSPTLLDTRGNVDGNTGFYLKLSLESGNNDIPTQNGEGEFREFAVARFLWDTFDTENGEVAGENAFDNLQNHFKDFWEAFANTTKKGLNSVIAGSRSIGLLLQGMNSNMGGTLNGNANWITLIVNEKLNHPSTDPNQSFRGSFGMILIPGATRTFHLNAPFDFPQVDVDDNDPISNINFHSFNTSSSRSFTFNVTANNGGALKLRIYRDTVTDFNTGAIATLNNGQSFTLPAGGYLMLVIVTSRPSGNGNLDYSFSGLTSGSL